MPAPLAKGLLISFSILFAASLAVYENNPEIREWVDNSRRKIAVALHNFGDEIAPPFPSRNPNPPRDASTREDESPEAADRRRRARQEIIERGRVLEERRRAKRAGTRTFDDLVDKDGVLKNDGTPESIAQTTSAETQPQPETSELKKRKIEAAGAAMGARLANPFADEAPMEHDSTVEDIISPRQVDDLVAITGITPHEAESWLMTYDCDTDKAANAYFDEKEILKQEEPSTDPWANIGFYSATASEVSQTRSNTPSLPATSPHEQGPSTPRTPGPLLIDTDDLSTHASEQLLDLTPTSTPTIGMSSPSSARPDNLVSLSPISPSTPAAEEDEAPPPAAWPVSMSEWEPSSINAWAENTSASFYSAPQSQSQPTEQRTPTVSESGEHVSQIGSEDMDVMSEIGGISTPGSWTEVGSDSGDEFRGF